MPDINPPLNVAIVGTGIAGLTSAYLLQRAHQITVFEANDYIGGHTNTVTVSHRGRPLPVDTGFIVYNTQTYCNLTRLFAELDVPTECSRMSFGVSCRVTGLEYGSAMPHGIFAQRRNLFQLEHWRLVHDYVRFCRDAKAGANDARYANVTLAQFAAQRGYSAAFTHFCLTPLASAIWSSPQSAIQDFPAQYLFRFYDNHGLLNIPNTVLWRTVTGGSQVYVQKMTKSFRERIHLSTPVRCVARRADGVTLTLADGTSHAFDVVVIATHSDQALRLLADPSDAEREVLGQIPYQKNVAVLHTDVRMLPRNRRAWAAWNYTLHVRHGQDQDVSMTYWMNALQNLNVDTNYCVTINPREPIEPRKIIKTMEYAHPLYSLESVNARERLPQLNGRRHTYFCGAYCGHGFHEDGATAGVRVAELLGVKW